MSVRSGRQDGEALVLYALRAFGLAITADRPLAPLLRDPSGLPPDVEITAAPVPESLSEFDVATAHWSANPREHLLAVPRVGRFLITDGRSVRYQPVPGVAESMLDAYLLGSCLGAVLHQRERQVLHAAAIEIEGRAFAICGRSGAGKSTTAAHLVAEGARLLSDDLAVFAEGGEPVLLPGYPQSKLTGEALGRLGRGSSDLRALPGERAKFALPRVAEFRDAPTPLAGIFVIEPAAAPEALFSRLAPAQAVPPLVRHTYRRHFVGPTRIARHFAAWGQVATRVPTFLAVRPHQGDSTAFILASLRRTFDDLGHSKEHAA